MDSRPTSESNQRISESTGLKDEIDFMNLAILYKGKIINSGYPLKHEINLKSIANSAWIICLP
jgi:hypothetical protein